MNAPSFELNVSLPHDVRLAEMVRELAVHAAQHAGYSEADARAFGQTVETIIRGHLANPDSTAILPVVVRRNTGPVEVLVDHQVLTPDA